MVSIHKPLRKGDLALMTSSAAGVEPSVMPPGKTTWIGYGVGSRVYGVGSSREILSFSEFSFGVLEILSFSGDQ